jgi:hypothetical protein
MRTLALYATAAVVYIAVGVAEPHFLLAWPVGVSYLLLAVWVVPSLLRRLR